MSYFESSNIDVSVGFDSYSGGGYAPYGTQYDSYASFQDTTVVSGSAYQNTYVDSSTYVAQQEGFYRPEVSYSEVDVSRTNTEYIAF